MNLKRILDSVNEGYVDLGLPSGTLWADRNVGANTPEDNGDYFTFEEAQELGKVPSEAQFKELKNECKWTWKDKGYVITGPNDNSIYLPADGYCNNSNVYFLDSDGYYWSSSASDKGCATCLNFDSDYAYIGSYYRFYGQSVRLVK